MLANTTTIFKHEKNRRVLIVEKVVDDLIATGVPDEVQTLKISF